MCEQCGGPINRSGGRSNGAGAKIIYCSECILERKRESYRRWISNPDNKKKVAESQRSKRKNDPDHSWSYSIKSRYNLTPDEYYEKLESQNNGCAICCSLITNTGNQVHFQVDHDHSCCPEKTSCGRCIRGLLCGKCNKILGAFNDDLETLEKAIAYLKRWKEEKC